MDKSYSKKPIKGEAWDVAIIGSGPAAMTAAIYTTRGAASTIVLGGREWGGQLMLTTHVDNFPSQPGIQGPELMKKMREHATMFGAEFVEKNVDRVNFDNKPFELSLEDEVVKATSVIIAIGADTKWLGIPGEESLRGRGVSSCAPCDAPFFKDKSVAVVGGGDSAMEEALVLTKYAKSVSIIHRRDEFKASAAMQSRVQEKIDEGKINVFWDTEVVEMLGENKLEKVKMKTKKDTQMTESIEKSTTANLSNEGDFLVYDKEFDGIFIAIGHKPATDIFKGSIDIDKKGYIEVKNHTSTSVQGVFVAGDVHDYHYRQAITAAGFGCMAAMDLLKYLDKPTPSW